MSEERITPKYVKVSTLVKTVSPTYNWHEQNMNKYKFHCVSIVIITIFVFSVVIMTIFVFLLRIHRHNNHKFFAFYCVVVIAVTSCTSEREVAFSLAGLPPCVQGQAEPVQLHCSCPVI